MPEFDRVMGGGFVRGAAVLIGGEPGIGKSTLVTQAALGIADTGATVIYFAGEESPEQVRARADRLGTPSRSFLLSDAVDADTIVRTLADIRPGLAIVDSVQTLATASVESPPGSVAQVRASASILVAGSRAHGVPIALVGHVNKEGAIAGPRVLEHVVDAVLEFEGDRHHAYRLLRTAKNRFGSTDELGMFEMREDGLREVPDASHALLNGSGQPSTGSAIAALLEGSRALLAEVQALVSHSYLPVPRRVVDGMDGSRVALLMAVLEKRAGVRVGDADAWVNVTGGLRVNDPAADLAAVVAVASSARDAAVRPGLVSIGEVGLGGELRHVPRLDLRLREAARLGLACAIVPEAQREGLRDHPLKVVGARTVAQALEAALA